MPPEPSVTSACEPPRSCTLRYSSALLPKSFERPGPKSVSPATYCSGVKVVVLWRWIVDMRAPYSMRSESVSFVEQPSREICKPVSKRPACYKGCDYIIDVKARLLDEGIGRHLGISLRGGERCGGTLGGENLRGISLLTNARAEVPYRARRFARVCGRDPMTIEREEQLDKLRSV